MTCPQRMDARWRVLQVLAGHALGLLLSLISRMLAGLGARRRAARVQRDLRAGVEQVARERILGEVDAELALLRQAREAADVAAR